MRISNKILQKFQEGDELATSIVFEEYKNLLYFIIASYVSIKEDCDDILNDTYLKILENRKSINDISKLKTFMTTIAKNEALQFLRKQKPTFVDNIDEIYGENDRENELLNLFGTSLTNKETIVVYYRAVFSYKWEEISLQTKIPISTLKVIYSKAIEKLRKELR